MLSRFLARCLRARQPELEWVPVPYEDRHLYPAPPPRNYGGALTADGKLAALEPRPRTAPLGRDPAKQSEQRRRAARSIDRMWHGEDWLADAVLGDQR